VAGVDDDVFFRVERIGGIEDGHVIGGIDSIAARPSVGMRVGAPAESAGLGSGPILLGLIAQAQADLVLGGGDAATEDDE
jgi:hypothetical protein